MQCDCNFLLQCQCKKFPPKANLLDEKSKAMVLIGQDGPQEGDQSEARNKDGKSRTKSPFRSGLTTKKGAKGGKGGSGGGGGATGSGVKSGKKGKKTAEEEDGENQFSLAIRSQWFL